MAGFITHPNPCIRPLDVNRDLLAVADLIDVCFADHMDEEGRLYVRQIRRAAHSYGAMRWMRGARERVSLPLHGYVWEENQRVVGNLTLIPFLWKGRWLYMIANVAVHPDFRQRGIGKELTQRALEHVREHGASAAWLQVRDDNPVAHHLYQSLGFKDRAVRATWHYPSARRSIEPISSLVQINSRSFRDWPQQRTWLEQTYPPEVAWNLLFSARAFAPSFWRTFFSMFSTDFTEHWSAYQNKNLLGTATYQHGMRLQDILWLAADPANEDLAVQSLLSFIPKIYPKTQGLVVNYPAGHANAAFEASGFTLHNTLIWMEVPFK